MQQDVFESMKLADFDNFVDVSHQLALWQASLLDPTLIHYHIQGGRWSGKTHLLEATLHGTHDWPRTAVWLVAEDFQQDKLLERDYADWYFVDDIDMLTMHQQSIFVAWLNQCIAHQGKIFTSSGSVATALMHDVQSRLQSALVVDLYHPRDEADWCRVIKKFFDRHYIDISDRIMLCILDVTQHIPARIFPLIRLLAHQPRQLTFQRIHATHRDLINY